MAAPRKYWSIARALEGSPRILRNPETLWLRDHLTLDELDQVLLANDLRISAITLALYAVLAGDTHVTSDRPGAPRIGKTRVTRGLHAQPVRWVHLNQRQFQGLSWKPRTFMVAHLPSAQHLFGLFTRCTPPPEGAHRRRQ